MLNIQDITDRFQSNFGHMPRVVARAPGRVNLIGEHTDYNGGYVLPIAIDRAIMMAGSRNDQRMVRFLSLDYDEEYITMIETAPLQKADLGWVNYCIAVIEQLRGQGFSIEGVDLAIQGNIPIGAGLSSSAAMEVCMAVLLRTLFGFEMHDKDLALLCQRAEHSSYIGVQCGIMDQFASLLAAENAALFLDCYSLQYKTIPFPSEKAAILIFDSGVRRQLVQSEYNRRRAECEEGLRLIRSLLKKEVPTLRHISPDELESIEPRIPEPVRRRVRHVITENQRVLDAIATLEKGDLAFFGRLLNQSHESLSYDYEVSCPELDTIVGTAREMTGVFGARLTGAGFGGCAIVVADPGSLSVIRRSVKEVYKDRHNLELHGYVTMPGSPAGILYPW